MPTRPYVLSTCDYHHEMCWNSWGVLGEFCLQNDLNMCKCKSCKLVQGHALGLMMSRL